MSEAVLRRELRELLGDDVAALEPLSGGDTCEAWAADLGRGERLFVKRPRRPTHGMASGEAQGLAWLAEARALRVPRVRGASASLLVLEWIEPGRASADFPEILGRGLAALHRAGGDGFGFASDNFIGPLVQTNRRHPSWADFYARERLEPQLRMARDAGLLSADFVRRAGALLDALGRVTGPEESPSRLHGDLWSGNCMVDDAGAPCLVDPAVYGGHREVDLAMMRLFGGFSESVFGAYAEAHPLAAGVDERVALYQLYPRLVHLNLFGASYRAGVEQGFEAYW